MKFRKQDNIGVSPLKQKGNLISDSKSKADILVEQFQSVFTKLTDNIMPNMSNRTIPRKDEIVIDFKGVEKLLSNLKTSKSVGPDSIPKIVNEYDQEIPQLQTADNPVAPRGRAAQPSRETRKTNKAKQPALSFPSR